MLTPNTQEKKKKKALSFQEIPHLLLIINDMLLPSDSLKLSCVYLLPDSMITLKFGLKVFLKCNSHSWSRPWQGVITMLPTKETRSANFITNLQYSHNSFIQLWVHQCFWLTLSSQMWSRIKAHKATILERSVLWSGQFVLLKRE